MAPSYGDIVLLSLSLCLLLCVRGNYVFGLIQYERLDLLHIRENLANFQPKLISYTKHVMTGPADASAWQADANPKLQLRPRKRGKRAGALVRLIRGRHRSPLPSILLSNVRSLVNKQNELSIVIVSRRLIADCSVLCFTESWLNAAVANFAVQQDGFTLHRANRTEASQKTKGGVCFSVSASQTQQSSHGPVLRFWRPSPYNSDCFICQGTSIPSYWSLYTFLHKQPSLKQPSNFLLTSRTSKTLIRMQLC